MPKTTVKDFRKNVKMMIEKHQKPAEMNPIDQMIKMAKDMNKGMMQ
jgi:hypothetical protein